MQVRQIQKSRIVLRDLIGKGDLSQLDDAVAVMKSILSTAVYSDPYTLIVIDFRRIRGIDDNTALPLCAAFAGIITVEWDRYFALTGLSGNSRTIVNKNMTDSNLVAVALTRTASDIFGRHEMVRGPLPIWQWLRDDGNWHSVEEIHEIFEDDDIRARYLGGQVYTVGQVRTATTRLFETGLAFISRTPRPIRYRAVGTNQDRVGL